MGNSPRSLLSKGAWTGVSRASTHPVLGLKLGSPIGGLWRVLLFFQLLCWNPHSQRDGGIGPREGSGKPPGSSPGLGLGLTCPLPEGMRELGTAPSFPCPVSFSQAGQEQRGGEQGPQPRLSPRVLRVGWRRGGERGSWPPTDTVNFGLKQ